MTRPRRQSHYRYLALLLSGLLLGVLNPVTAAQPIKVAYLSRPVERPFWNHFLKLAQAAADDLEIELEVKISSNDSEMLKQDGMALLSRDDKPDYFITGYIPGVTGELLDIAEQRGIKTFIVNSKIADHAAIGKPREKYRHWIGHLYPDDIATGYQLIDILITQYSLHSKAHRRGLINIIGVSGAPDSLASSFRLTGLEKRVNALPDARLLKTLDCYWERDCAAAVTLALLKEHPDTAIIWAASDLLALGAADAAAGIGRKPGKDIYIGGVDWSPPGLKAVAEGAMSVTMGGHFVEGAWALVLIHDYHNGMDFVNDPGICFETKMGAVTANNAEKFLAVLSDPDWNRIDFKHYSKKYNKSLKKYHFQVESIFGQLISGQE